MRFLKLYFIGLIFFYPAFLSANYYVDSELFHKGKKFKIYNKFEEELKVFEYLDSFIKESNRHKLEVILIIYSSESKLDQLKNQIFMFQEQLLDLEINIVALNVELDNSLNDYQVYIYTRKIN